MRRKLTRSLMVPVILARGGRQASDISAIFICFPIILTFWYLDAYYLRQERMYRRLYEWIIKYRKDNNQQSLDIRCDFLLLNQSVPGF